MVKYDFRNGQIYEVIDNSGGSSLTIGERWEVIENKSSDSETEGCPKMKLISTPNDSSKGYQLGRIDSGWYMSRFKLVQDVNSKIKPLKQQPIVKHVIVQDSCGNFIAFADSELAAITKAQNTSKENMTVYRLVEVAKVTTERKVTKVKPVAPKKK